MNLKSLPEAVLEHLNRLTIYGLKPAWVQINHNHPVNWGGDWEHFGVPSFDKRGELDEQLPFIAGMLGEGFADIDLPFMEMDNGIIVDVYLFHAEESDWLLLLDASERAERHQRLQQAANELSLLRGRQSKLLDQYLGASMAEKLASGLFEMDADGERREITTMFVDLRNFTVFNESHEPAVVMATLNEYLDAMIQPILAEAGIVDKITGDGAMALFGVMPSVIPASIHAVKAAIAMQKSVMVLNVERREQKLPTLDIGVGIASGTAVLGILGSKDRRTITVIGRHVNLAARLESQARPNEILLDEATFEMTGNFGFEYVIDELILKGISSPVKTYRIKIS